MLLAHLPAHCRLVFVHEGPQAWRRHVLLRGDAAPRHGPGCKSSGAAGEAARQLTASRSRFTQPHCPRTGLPEAAFLAALPFQLILTLAASLPLLRSQGAAYSSAISACGRAGQLARMLELRDEMQRKGMELTHNTRLAMLHAFAGARRQGLSPRAASAGVGTACLGTRASDWPVCWRRPVAWAGRACSAVATLLVACCRPSVPHQARLPAGCRRGQNARGAVRV